MNKKARFNMFKAVSQQKSYKKMYKAKKQWVVAAMAVLAVPAALATASLHPNVHADTTNQAQATRQASPNAIQHQGQGLAANLLRNSALQKPSNQQQANGQQKTAADNGQGQQRANDSQNNGGQKQATADQSADNSKQVNGQGQSQAQNAGQNNGSNQRQVADAQSSQGRVQNQNNGANGQQQNADKQANTKNNGQQGTDQNSQQKAGQPADNAQQSADKGHQNGSQQSTDQANKNTVNGQQRPRQNSGKATGQSNDAEQGQDNGVNDINVPDDDSSIDPSMLSQYKQEINGVKDPKQRQQLIDNLDQALGQVKGYNPLTKTDLSQNQNVDDQGNPLPQGENRKQYEEWKNQTPAKMELKNDTLYIKDGIVNNNNEDDGVFGATSFGVNYENVSKIVISDAVAPKDSSYLFGYGHHLSDITGDLDTSHATNMSNMFVADKELTGISSLKNWNVSNVNDMDSMFEDDDNLSDISSLKNWNVSNVNDMDSMFYTSTGSSLTNIHPLSNWDVSNVNDMNGMFAGNKVTDITPITDNWTVNSGKTDVRDMMPDSSTPTLKLITNAPLKGKYGFNNSNPTGQLPSANVTYKFGNQTLDTGKVNLSKSNDTIPSTSLTYQSNGTDYAVDPRTSLVKNGLSASKNGSYTVQLDKTGKTGTATWYQTPSDTTGLTDVNGKQLAPNDLYIANGSIGGQDLPYGEDAKQAAIWAAGGKNGQPLASDGSNAAVPAKIVQKGNTLYIKDGVVNNNDYEGISNSGANYQNVSDIVFSDVVAPKGSKNLFNSLPKLNKIIGNLDTSNVNDMGAMFCHDTNLANIRPLSDWNVSNVNDMSVMFSSDTNLANIRPLSDWNVSNVNDMSAMFSYDTNLANIRPLSDWNVSNVMSMISVFSDDSKIMDTKPITNNWCLNNGAPHLGANCSKMMPDGSSPSLEPTGHGTYGFNNSHPIQHDYAKEQAQAHKNVSTLSPLTKSVDGDSISQAEFNNVTGRGDVSNYMSNMPNLTKVNASGLDTTDVSNMTNFFSGDNKLTQLTLGNKTKLGDNNGLDDAANDWYRHDNNVRTNLSEDDSPVAGLYTKGEPATDTISYMNGTDQVGTDSVKGVKGQTDSTDATKDVPFGYQLAPNADTSFQFNNGSHNVSVDPKTMTDSINYVDGSSQNRGNTQVTGQYGSNQTVSGQNLDPNYELSGDGSQGFKIDGKTHTVNVKPVPETDTVNYVANGSNEGSTSISGNKGDTKSVDGTGISPHYHLANQTNNITLNGDSHSVNVAPDHVTDSIGYTYKNNPEGTANVSGDYDSNVTVSKDNQGALNNDYQLANDGTQTFKLNAGHHTVDVVPIGDTDTIDYQYNGNNISTPQVQGNKGTQGTADGSGLNSNYEISPNADKTFTYNNGSHTVTVVPKTETENINYVDSGDTSHGTTTVSGKYGTSQSVNGNGLNSDYQLANDGSQNFKIGDGTNNTHNVNVKAIPETDTVNYMNGTDNVGSTTLSGDKGQHETANGTGIDSNYHLKDDGTENIILNGGKHNVNAQANHESEPVDYVYNGNNEGTTNVSGDYGSKVDTPTNGINPGYQLAKGDATQIEINGSSQNVNVEPLSENVPVKFYDQNGKYITDGTATGKTGSTLDLNGSHESNDLPSLPDGYHWVASTAHQTNNTSYTVKGADNDTQNVALQGNAEDVTATVHVNEPNGTQADKTITLHGNVGDTGSVKPNDWNNGNVPAGYTMSNSTNVDGNGNADYTLSPNGQMSWAKGVPTFSYSAKPEKVTLNYVNQNGQNVGSQDVTKSMNYDYSFGDNGASLQLPDGYAYDSSKAGNPTEYKFTDGNGQQKTVYVKGTSNKANDTVTVHYVNQNGKTVATPYFNGDVGDSAKPADNVPNGYTADNGQKSNVEYNYNQPQTITYHVTGKNVSYSPKVSVHGDNLPSDSATVTLNGRVGDTATVDPSTLTAPKGYTLSTKDSTGLVGNKLSATLNPTGISWNNGMPIVYYTANPQNAKVNYVDQNSNPTQSGAVQVIHGTTNQSVNFDSGHNALNIPTNYVYDSSVSNNPNSYKFTTANGQSVTVHVKGVQAGMTVDYVDGNGNVISRYTNKGNTGDNVDISSHLPEGYAPDASKSQTANVTHNGDTQSVTYHVTGNKVTGNITVNAEFHKADGTNVNKTTNVPFDSSIGHTITIDPSNYGKAGYESADKPQVIKLTGDVAPKGNVNNYSKVVNFEYETAAPINVAYRDDASHAVITKQAVNGSLGQKYSDITKNVAVPTDYAIDNGQSLTYTIGDNAQNATINVHEIGSHDGVNGYDPSKADDNYGHGISGEDVPVSPNYDPSNVNPNTSNGRIPNGYVPAYMPNSQGRYDAGYMPKSNIPSNYVPGYVPDNNGHATEGYVPTDHVPANSIPSYIQNGHDGYVNGYVIGKDQLPAGYYPGVVPDPANDHQVFGYVPSNKSGYAPAVVPDVQDNGAVKPGYVPTGNDLPIGYVPSVVAEPTNTAEQVPGYIMGGSELPSSYVPALVTDPADYSKQTNGYLDGNHLPANYVLAEVKADKGYTSEYEPKANVPNSYVQHSMAKPGNATQQVNGYVPDVAPFVPQKPNAQFDINDEDRLANPTANVPRYPNTNNGNNSNNNASGNIVVPSVSTDNSNTNEQRNPTNLAGSTDTGNGNHVVNVNNQSNDSGNIHNRNNGKFSRYVKVVHYGKDVMVIDPVDANVPQEHINGKSKMDLGNGEYATVNKLEHYNDGSVMIDLANVPHDVKDIFTNARYDAPLMHFVRPGVSFKAGKVVLTDATPKSHFKFMYLKKNLQFHGSAMFTKHDVIKALRTKMGLTLPVIKVVKAHYNGHDYYRYFTNVKIGKRNYRGFVTAWNRYTGNAYLQRRDLSHVACHGAYHYVTIKRTALEHRTRNFTGKDVYRKLHAGTTVRVKKVITIGCKDHQMTRLVLSNGRYLTANKNWVKAVD